MPKAKKPAATRSAKHGKLIPSKASDEVRAEHIKEREEPKTGVLRERAMLVRFSISRWYGTGADESVVSDVKKKHEASGDIGNFTKRFMSRERLAPINQVTNDARKFHKNLTLPWGGTGSRLLSADLFFEYKKEMTAYQMKFGEAVSEFIANYPKFIKAEKERLNSLFKESDYPSAEDMRARFSWALNIEPIPSAEDFRVDLGEEELKRLRSEIEQRVDESMRDASKEIWERMSELVSKVKERLSETDPHPRASLFENIKELVAVLPRLNITNDPALKSMGERLTKELLSFDIQAVREDDAVRKEVVSKADKILDVMGTFAKTKPAPAAKKGDAK